MQKRKTQPLAERPEVKTGSLDDACVRYSFGRPTMRRVAEDAGAVVRIGRCYRVNFTKVDKYLDAIAE